MDRTRFVAFLWNWSIHPIERVVSVGFVKFGYWRPKVSPPRSSSKYIHCNCGIVAHLVERMSLVCEYLWFKSWCEANGWAWSKRSQSRGIALISFVALSLGLWLVVLHICESAGETTWHKMFVSTCGRKRLFASSLALKDWPLLREHWCFSLEYMVGLDVEFLDCNLLASLYWICSTRYVVFPRKGGTNK